MIKVFRLLSVLMLVGITSIMTLSAAERCRSNRPCHYELVYKGECADWIFSGEFLYQTPISLRKRLVTDDNTGRTLLNLHDFHPGFSPGVRTHLAYMEPCWGIDGGFATNEWHKSETITGPNNLDAVLGSTNFFQGSLFSGSYKTIIRTYELNMVYKFDRYLTGFFGGSVITLKERFFMDSTNASTSHYNIITRNGLYGLQAGFNVEFPLPILGCSTVDAQFICKGGAYWNDVCLKVFFDDPIPPGSPVVGPLSYNKNHGRVSYAAEANGYLVYSPYKGFRFYSGYMFSVYNNVGLAGKQYHRSIAAFQQKHKIDFHNYYIHGLVAGGEVRF